MIALAVMLFATCILGGIAYTYEHSSSSASDWPLIAGSIGIKKRRAERGFPQIRYRGRAFPFLTLNGHRLCGHFWTDRPLSGCYGL